MSNFSVEIRELKTDVTVVENVSRTEVVEVYTQVAIYEQGDSLSSGDVNYNVVIQRDPQTIIVENQSAVQVVVLENVCYVGEYECSNEFDEIRLIPKMSSTGLRGTVFFCSEDDHLWVATA